MEAIRASVLLPGGDPADEATFHAACEAAAISGERAPDFRTLHVRVRVVADGCEPLDFAVFPGQALPVRRLVPAPPPDPNSEPPANDDP